MASEIFAIFSKMFTVAFLVKFSTKINFVRRNSVISKSLPGQQNIEDVLYFFHNIQLLAVQNMAVSQWFKIKQRGNHFSVFSVPRADHLRLPMDRSRSQLFISFFRISFRFLLRRSLPNELFCFSNFGHFCPPPFNPQVAHLPKSATAFSKNSILFSSKTNNF